MKKLLPLALIILTACPGKTPVTPPPTPIAVPEHESNVQTNIPPPPLQATQIKSSIKLCWDPSPDSTVTSYALYQDSVQVQEVTTYFTNVDGLTPGQMYLFWVTAKAPNADGSLPENESEPSNKLKYIVPTLTIDTNGVHWTQPETNFVANQSYTLLSTTNLATTNWTSYPYTVDGTNATAAVDFTKPQMFFRLRVDFGGATCQ